MALWELSSKDHPGSLFSTTAKDAHEEQIDLPEMKLSEYVIYDYATTSLSVKAHPVSFAREKLHQLNVLSASKLAGVKHGRIVKVAGLILVRQRPGTAKGVWLHHFGR